jgi:hypothetical protein
MSDYSVGFLLGLAVGFTGGIAIARQSKPWSEMTERERRMRTGLIVAGAVALAAGIVTLFLVK